MKKWPHKCTGWKPSEDPDFCANCGNIASGHKGPTPGAHRQILLTVPVNPAPAPARLCRRCGQKWLPEANNTLCPVCESPDTIKL